MRVRYTTRRPARSWWDDNFVHAASPMAATTIYEDDIAPEDTGILDADGNPIFRTYERNPVGFVHFIDE